jgi:HD domain
LRPGRLGLVLNVVTGIVTRTARKLAPISSTTRRVRRYCTGLVRNLILAHRSHVHPLAKLLILSLFPERLRTSWPLYCTETGVRMRTQCEQDALVDSAAARVLQIMERHVELGYDLVKGIPFLADAAGIILAHHERHNGSGYPRGLRGKDIPMFARIFAVVDSFDAMTSDRPYRSALPVHTARSVVDAGRGELFDPEIVDAFFAVGEDAWKLISADPQTTSTHKIICGNGLTLTSARALTSQVPHLEKVAN